MSGWADLNICNGQKYVPGVRMKTKWAKKCDLEDDGMPPVDAAGHYDGAVDRGDGTFGFLFKDGKSFINVNIRAKSGLFDDDALGVGQSQATNNSFSGFVVGTEEENINFYDEVTGEELIVLGQQKTGTWRVLGSIDDPAFLQSGAKLSTDTEAKDGDVNGLAFTLMAYTGKAARIYKNPAF